MAVPSTGGTSLALTFAAVGAGISVAATGLGAVGSGETEDGSLEGGSPEVVVESLRERLVRLKELIADAESTIYDRISSTQSEVAYTWPEVCLPRPQYSHAQTSKYDDPVYNGESNG